MAELRLDDRDVQSIERALREVRPVVDSELRQEFPQLTEQDLEVVEAATETMMRRRAEATLFADALESRFEGGGWLAAVRSALEISAQCFDPPGLSQILDRLDRAGPGVFWDDELVGTMGGLEEMFLELWTRPVLLRNDMQKGNLNG